MHTHRMMWWDPYSQNDVASSDVLNIGSGDGLVPDGTKSSPEPMLTYDLGPGTNIQLGAVVPDMLKMGITKWA